jgi:hypothetical protein
LSLSCAWAAPEAQISRAAVAMVRLRFILNSQIFGRQTGRPLRARQRLPLPVHDCRCQAERGLKGLESWRAV